MTKRPISTDSQALLHNFSERYSPRTNMHFVRQCVLYFVVNWAPGHTKWKTIHFVTYQHKNTMTEQEQCCSWSFAVYAFVGYACCRSFPIFYLSLSLSSFFSIFSHYFSLALIHYLSRVHFTLTPSPAPWHQQQHQYIRTAASVDMCPRI